MWTILLKYRKGPRDNKATDIFCTYYCWPSGSRVVCLSGLPKPRPDTSLLYVLLVPHIHRVCLDRPINRPAGPAFRPSDPGCEIYSSPTKNAV